jgi:SAM-dependent methyltransferase
MTLHPVAAGGFSAAASTYAKVRPTYARGAVGLLADRVRAIGRPARVLDVGAGTGILTGQLHRAGLACWAVEPLAAMGAQLRLALPGVPLLRATAEALPVRSRSVDLVTVAQAFHWMDPDRSIEEFARVGAPGGALALLWNVRDTRVGWVAALDELVEARTGGRPYDRHGARAWDEVLTRSGRFRVIHERSFPNPVPTTVEGVLDRLRSTSFVAALDPEPRAELLAAAAELLRADPATVGTFEHPHTTELLLCERA